MARTKPIRRSYGAGEWGRNRVRVFPDPKTGLFQIEWRDNGRRLTRSLKHRDWRRAKRQADEFAAGYLGPEMHGKAEAEPEPLTLETLFDIYGEEVTPTKCEQARRHDRAATRMFLGCFGRDRKPATLSQRDWDRFIRERRAGRVGASGSPVSDRTIEYDLKFLIAVLNWAAKSRDEQGRLLLDSNPLKGLKTPKEKNPTRVVLSEEEYQALLEVSLPGRLAVSCRSGPRTRDRTPHRRHPSASMVGHRHGRRSGAVARRAREVGLRTPDAGDRRGARRLGGGAKEESRYRRRARAALAAGSLEVRELFVDAALVGEGRSARRAGIQAWPRLAFPEAEVRLRPHEPATQGALRVGWLEDGQDGAPVLPEGRRGTAQDGSGKPPQSSRLIPIGGNQMAGIRPAKPVSSIIT